MLDRQISLPPPALAALAPDPAEVLFTSVELSGLTLKNRLVMAPMGTCLDRGGFITDETIAYYRRRAEGGIGTITVEGCLVSADTVGPEPGIHGRQHLAGLASLVEALRPYDITVGVQLMHPGRQVVDGPRVAPSAVALNSSAPVPHALTTGEIDRIVEDYARATALAEEAGFDFVEVHGAHGYLPSDFLSPLSNIRDDAYGGSAENRALFSLQVAAAIRSACDGRMPLVWRLNGDDALPGGFAIDGAIQVSQWLQRAGVASISVSAGTWHTLHVTLAPMFIPRGHIVHLARAIKREVDIPVMAVGRLDDPVLGAEIIAGGDADLLILGRVLIAEPDWPNKVRAGDVATRRPCIACNACVDLVGRGVPARCAVNPEAGRELSWRVEPAAVPRRVMVIGSGPAGMEAARLSRMRGHHVSIWERDRKLGGKLEVAGLAPSKGEVLKFRDYQSRVIEDLGVEIHLGTEVTRAHIAAEAPDVIVVATGADPLVPPIPGIGGPTVHDAQAILRGEVPVTEADRVVVVGGSATGCETAELLAGTAAAVTILEMRGSVGMGIEAITRRLLVRTLRGGGVDIRTRAKVIMVEDDHVIYELPDGSTDEMPADIVALALGWRPRGNHLGPEVDGVEVIVLGDALKPADFVHAINAGADAGLIV
jgi:2,4-dienoyl-CoA reductase-like NADH-dependent reductase (Old Yellow Enzyme family)/thioredoxin reductase